LFFFCAALFHFLPHVGLCPYISWSYFWGALFAPLLGCCCRPHALLNALVVHVFIQSWCVFLCFRPVSQSKLMLTLLFVCSILVPHILQHHSISSGMGLMIFYLFLFTLCFSPRRIPSGSAPLLLLATLPSSCTVIQALQLSCPHPHPPACYTAYFVHRMSRVLVLLFHSPALLNFTHALPCDLSLASERDTLTGCVLVIFFISFPAPLIPLTAYPFTRALHTTSCIHIQTARLHAELVPLLFLFFFPCCTTIWALTHPLIFFPFASPHLRLVLSICFVCRVHAWRA